MGQGGSTTGLDPRLYTEAELTRITPVVNTDHGTICGSSDNCPANTAAYLVSLSPKLAKGEVDFTTLGDGACVACHGAKGGGSTRICTVIQTRCTAVKTYTQIKAKVEVMGEFGDEEPPYLCTSANGSSCSEDVSLFLKAFNWTRKAP
jgi:hypothetical protein